MNFLGHAYISLNHEQLLIGNFIADFVKGSELHQFDRAIQNGIRLHRRIDAFTDFHPIFLRSKKILQPKYRHYSGVIVDIIYDHMLARYWQDFHDQDLLEFTESMYKTLLSYEEVLPLPAQQVLVHMVPNNWLYNYRSIEGTDRALIGMARRARYASRMDEAIEDLKANYSIFEEDFREFLPAVLAEARLFIKVNS